MYFYIRHEHEAKVWNLRKMDVYEADLKTRWDDLTGWIVDDVKSRWWDRIKSAYTENHRHYHTLKHLFHLFHFYDVYKDNLKNRYACAYAIFFHDLVYDPTKSEENESKSAAEFNKFCKETTFDDASYVTNLIETTASHCTEAHMQPNDYGSDDIHYLLDFDMAILGSDPEEYSVYKNQIRQEYSHLQDDSYRSERAKVLRLFLQIPNIFATKLFRDLYEQKARTNIEKEIKELSN